MLLIHYKITGIYKITNVINNKVYVGASANSVKYRIRQHITLLKSNRHHNKQLQNSWNLHGEASFTYELIEEVSDISLIANREQYWIDSLQATKRYIGFNVLPIAFSQKRKKNISECKICKQINGVLTKGKCHTCYNYYWRFRKERPYIINGKYERKIKNKQIYIYCSKCKKEFLSRLEGKAILCASCNRWKNKVIKRHSFKENKCRHCGVIKKITSDNRYYLVNGFYQLTKPECIARGHVPRYVREEKARNTRNKKKGLQNLF